MIGKSYGKIIPSREIVPPSSPNHSLHFPIQIDEMWMDVCIYVLLLLNKRKLYLPNPTCKTPSHGAATPMLTTAVQAFLAVMVLVV